MPKKKPLIMIVEDEPLLLKAIQKKLKLSGFDTVSCAGGNQALDYLKSLNSLPDAIWLDYYVKDIDGLKIMNNIKNSERWSKIPVFVVSNSASQDKILSMLALGAKRYFLKAEHRLTDIIELIGEYIKDNPREASTEESPPETATKSQDISEK